jgi:hypothetical protein
MVARLAPCLGLALVAAGCAQAVPDVPMGCHDAGCNVDMANPCPGKNLQDDPMNCGACGHNCATAHVALANCASGQCAILSCATGWIDYDGKPDNGCECQKSAAAAPRCADARDQAVTDASSSQLTMSGSITMAGGEDWYRITSTDDPDADGTCNIYHLAIHLTQNPKGQFRLDVVEDDCTTAATCGGTGEQSNGIDQYDFDASGECPCYNSATPPAGAHQCANHSQVVRVRVYRQAGVPASCDVYTLTVTNG